jgi:predicted amidohydrolase
MRIRVGQVKAMPVKGDLAANHARLMELLRSVEPGTVDVVVTPECFLDGYVVTEEWITPQSLLQYGVSLDSAYLTEAAEWVAGAEVWLILGCTTVKSGKARNTALIYDRAGHLIGRYDKVHCQTHDKKFVPGNRLPIFSSDFGPFGVMICADRRWPETVRTLALKGARIIFNPTYGMHDERNLCMMRTRSYESEVFIAFTHPLQALITDPTGRVVRLDESEAEGVVITEVDLSLVDEVRAGPSAHLRDRRPDVYEGA